MVLGLRSPPGRLAQSGELYWGADPPRGWGMEPLSCPGCAVRGRSGFVGAMAQVWESLPPL